MKLKYFFVTVLLIPHLYHHQNLGMTAEQTIRNITLNEEKLKYRAREAKVTWHTQKGWVQVEETKHNESKIIYKYVPEEKAWTYSEFYNTCSSHTPSGQPILNWRWSDWAPVDQDDSKRLNTWYETAKQALDKRK